MPSTPDYRRRRLDEDPRWYQRRNLRRRYGLSLDDFDAMVAEQQEGACALCDSPFGDKTPCVDHDHVTGDIRGLLCRTCNTLVGWYENSRSRLGLYLGEEV